MDLGVVQYKTIDLPVLSESEAVVIGGSFGGVASALVLAREGHRVTLIEHRQAPSLAAAPAAERSSSADPILPGSQQWKSELARNPYASRRPENSPGRSSAQGRSLAPRCVAGRNSDNTFIKQVFGWEPGTPFREGLA